MLGDLSDPSTAFVINSPGPGLLATEMLKQGTRSLHLFEKNPDFHNYLAVIRQLFFVTLVRTQTTHISYHSDGFQERTQRSCSQPRRSEFDVEAPNKWCQQIRIPQSSRLKQIFHHQNHTSDRQYRTVWNHARKPSVWFLPLQQEEDRVLLYGAQRSWRSKRLASAFILPST